MNDHGDHAQDAPAAGGDSDFDIAVIGMAGRFPGAPDLDRFWTNIRDGVCSVTWFDDDDLRRASVDPRVREDPAFVPAGFVLDDVGSFDAGLFGYSPREAELIDPQHRLLLETAWLALDDAGIDPSRTADLVGVYTGSGASSYLMFNIATRPDLIDSVGGDQALLGNRPDFLASRVSYKLGLEGPSIDVQSACSSSLVAVVLACQGLLSFQCDVALAGGVSVDVLRDRGYTYQPDGLLSPDGMCRTFDADAKGTVGGDGVGIVALKRLGDAVAAGDHIRAVIKGSALNNDGAERAGFTAPRADGQAMVITTALANAGVEPADIGYVEAHGTATVLGDPIEFAGLTAAFAGAPRGGCALGSVKPNIGHLDAAAGIAGLIKTVLCLQHRVLPPLLHFQRPNPGIELASSPFRIPTHAQDWSADVGPRRAGVSSFGLGGTNAHVVLEEAPVAVDLGDRPGTQLLLLSARTEAGLDATTERLADALRVADPPALADLAHTLQNGRRVFPVRRAVVCRSSSDARDVLDDRSSPRMLTATTTGPRPVAFLFTGLGESYPGMGRELYDQESAFRAVLDECAALYAGLAPDSDDLREVLFSTDGSGSTGGRDRTKGPGDLRALFDAPVVPDHPLADPRVGHAALFALEFSLAGLWRASGVEPSAMLGHSLGEYVAACLAGVFALPDALRLVRARGELLAQLPGGAMLGVPLPEAEVVRFLDDQVCLAAVNGPRTCVLAGPEEAIDRVAAALRSEGNASRRLATRHAFHSAMTDPVIEPYRRVVEQVELMAPRLRFVSNATGTWITPDQATDARYWSRHLRAPVRFAESLSTLLAESPALLEIGPGRTLTSLALQHPSARSARDLVATTSLPVGPGERAEREHLLDARAQLWLAGVPQDWSSAVGTPAQTAALPGHAFERQRYWVDAQPVQAARSSRPGRAVGADSWFWLPTWHRVLPATGSGVSGRPPAGPLRWLLLADRRGVGDALAARLLGRGDEVVRVDRVPAGAAAWRALAERCQREGVPSRLVHLWGLDPAAGPDDRVASSFGALVGWLQAVEPALAVDPPRWDVITSGALSVTGDELVDPAAAVVLGFARVAPQEYPGMRVHVHDVLAPDTGDVLPDAEHVADELLAALGRDDLPAVSAVRGRTRWTPGHQRVDLQPAAARVLADGDTLLITGGLGKIGLTLALDIARRVRVDFVLVGRTAEPDEGQARALAEIERAGSRTLVLAADVSDEPRMRAVVAEATERFGSIDGVLHAAGSTGPAAHRVLSEIDAEQLARHLDPKLHGLHVLDRVLTGQPIRVALLFSSLASVLGGLGFGSYAGANAALDAASDRPDGPWLRWTSIGWEAWQFDDDASGAAGIGSALAELALRPDQGMAVLDRVLGAPVGRVVVSTGDLDERVRQWSDPGQSTPDNAPAADRHPRPNLRNAYVAPGTDLEQRIAAIWGELLGINAVGLHDSFFELGGSSLLGLQVVQRLRQQLHVPVPLTVVYEGPTVGSLAALLLAAQPPASIAPGAGAA